MKDVDGGWKSPWENLIGEQFGVDVNIKNLFSIMKLIVEFQLPTKPIFLLQKNKTFIQLQSRKPKKMTKTFIKVHFIVKISFFCVWLCFAKITIFTLIKTILTNELISLWTMETYKPLRNQLNCYIPQLARLN